MNTAEFPKSPELLLTYNAPNFSELHYHTRIDAMTEQEKWHWLSNHILKEEHRLLREPHDMPQIRAEAKIMFLTGGPKHDVTEARDFEGNLIHTRHLDHPRPMAAEISEATNAISHWFDLIIQSKENNTPPPSIVAPMSEISDVVYNISHLITLDPYFWEEYVEYLKRIAESLGFTMDQLLTITIYKYNFRLGQGKSQKNISFENDLLAKVLSQVDAEGKPLYPTPTEAQFQKTYHTLAEVETLLNTRLEQLRQEHEWKKNPVGPRQNLTENKSLKLPAARES